MLAPIYSETLEKFYRRVYGAPRPVRMGSMALVAMLTTYVHVWTPLWAGLWLATYVASELVMIAWWRHSQVRLASADRAGVSRLETELIAICAVSCAICAIPCFLTPLTGRDNQVLGVVLSAGVLLVIAAEHSLRKWMFLATAPAAAIALLWNLYSLGHGFSAWIFLFMGGCYVVNARTLQLSNAKVFLDLVKLRADADAANNAKSDFLATMSHEIRTPLNGVLGMAQLMLRGELATRQREQLGVIADSGQALLAVLNSVLDLSKIESGKLELEHGPFDLEETVKSASAAYGPLATQKSLGFSVEVAPEARGVWRGDAGKLGQVLANLLSNALKFTTRGAIGLEVGLAPAGLSFLVTDTGIGVAADKLSLIFDRFTQADASTTRNYGGTGLGLAICQKLVALMGGELTVESQFGAGSRFAFTLPLEREAQPLAQPTRTDSAPTSLAPSVRILAAEDNPTNQLILTAILTSMGVELTLVSDGTAAVEAFATGAFDLILMDVQMPRMDGLEATAEIRRIEAASGRAPTPVIALTANVLRHQIEAYRAAGMDTHVAKPIELDALVRAIESMLAGPQQAAVRETVAAV